MCYQGFTAPNNFIKLSLSSYFFLLQCNTNRCIFLSFPFLLFLLGVVWKRKNATQKHMPKSLEITTLFKNCKSIDFDIWILLWKEKTISYKSPLIHMSQNVYTLLIYIHVHTTLTHFLKLKTKTEKLSVIILHIIIAYDFQNMSF